MPMERAMKTQRMSTTRKIADWAGMAASGACAIHCILVPTLLVTGTLLPAFALADESFHLAMLWLILPAAIVAFGIGCWRHKDQWVLTLGAIGLLGMVSAVTFFHDVAGELGERTATIVSAALLIAAHYRNYRICRTMDCEHDRA